MANNPYPYLEKLFKDSGLRIDTIHKALLISHKTFQAKRYDVSKFSFGEIVLLHQILSKTIDGVTFESFCKNLKLLLPEDFPNQNLNQK